jgi:hypothetical protein
MSAEGDERLIALPSMGCPILRWRACASPVYASDCSHDHHDHERPARLVIGIE